MRRLPVFFLLGIFLTPLTVKHAGAEPPRFTLSPPQKEILYDDAAAEQPRFVERVTAESGAISRRDGFLMLWQSIRREAMETGEKPFQDVRENSMGFLPITYAKNRGLLDDEEAFRPDANLWLQDALLWLFRTRSVDAIEKMTSADLPRLLLKYPLGDMLERTETGEEVMIDRIISSDELPSLMRTLDRLLVKEVHEVSLYAEKFHGKRTAFGEMFDMNVLTAAHRTFPWNTLVRVTNIANGKSVVVRINDRGPFVEGRDMDLSLAAFTSIEDRSKGKFLARFDRLGDATLAGPCVLVSRYQKRLGRNGRFTRGVPHSFGLGGTLMLAANRAFAVREVQYPDGERRRLQDFVLPKEQYSFTPSIPGMYVFRIGIIEGRVWNFRMNVVECGT